MATNKLIYEGEWIMEEYEFCKKTINEYFEVKKDGESTIK